MSTPEPQKPSRWWAVPGTVGLGTIIAAAVVGALGVRYDERGTSPGPLVYIAVLMMLPVWIAVPLLQVLMQWLLNKLTPPQPQQLTPAMLEVLRKLEEASHQAREKGSITAVVNTLAPTESTDDGQRR